MTNEITQKLDPNHNTSITIHSTKPSNLIAVVDLITKLDSEHSRTVIIEITPTSIIIDDKIYTTLSQF